MPVQTMSLFPGDFQTAYLKSEDSSRRSFATDRSSNDSWDTQYSSDELRPDVFAPPGLRTGIPKPNQGDRGSPLSHFQALERTHPESVGLHGVSLASLRLEEQTLAPIEHSFSGEHQSVGWGGRPLQQQQRFKQRGEEQGPSAYYQMQRNRTSQPRGRQPAPNQRPAKGGYEGRVKNQGYRRLWQQVTQVNRGQRLGESNNIPFSEMTVEDLLEIVRRLPPEASAVKAVAQGLYFFDSGALAALLKELNKSGHTRRAQEIFDWLRNLDDSHDLYSLCTTMTYTTMISQCGSQQQLRRALELVAEMRSRGVQCNVHTYSALMNVCIKANELDLALDVYRQMLNEGCTPNLVTFNTLIDVYGKTGSWEEAVGVLDLLEQQGIEAEIRTYNTVIIACNMSGRAQEALKIYERMLAAGAQPTATTYTALISAYGKNGQLDRALEIFQDMVRRGCERNVITYSSLISACEKGGRWELALELFKEMNAEGCRPNVVTYNSLIAACAQGAQWEKAQELFEAMQQKGCKPDSVTFGGLIAAYDRAGLWRRALATFEQLRSYNCRPDSVVYNIIVGALWKTGLVWAQTRAIKIFQAASRQGHFRLTVHTLDASAVTDSTPASALASPATAALALACERSTSVSAAGSGTSSPSSSRLLETAGSLASSLEGALPPVDGHPSQTGVPEGSRCLSPASRLSLTSQSSLPDDAALNAAAASAAVAAGSAPRSPPTAAGLGAGTVIEFGMHAFTVGSAVLSMLRWVAELRERLPKEHSQELKHSVCLVLNKGKPSRDHAFPAIKDALAALLTAWGSPFILVDVPLGCRIQALACDITPWLYSPQADVALAAFLNRPDPPRGNEASFHEDLAIESRCMEAMAAVRMFEAAHPLDTQQLPATYLDQRREWFATAAAFAAALGFKDEVVLDSLLLLDRVVACGGEAAVGGSLPAMLVLATLLISARQGEHPDRLPTNDSLEPLTGLPASALSQTEATVRQLLGNDTAAISSIRVAKLYLERLGANFSLPASLRGTAGAALPLITELVSDPGLLGRQPSLLAAAALLAARRAAGLTPFWPQALQCLTGHVDGEGSELEDVATRGRVLLRDAFRGLVL